MLLHPVVKIIRFHLVMIKTLLKVTAITGLAKVMNMIIIVLKTELVGVMALVKWLKRVIHLKMRYSHVLVIFYDDNHLKVPSNPMNAKKRRINNLSIVGKGKDAPSLYRCKSSSLGLPILQASSILPYFCQSILIYSRLFIILDFVCNLNDRSF